MQLSNAQPVSTAPTASNALLTAALSGLLCLTASCTPGPSNPPADSGVATDSPAVDSAPAPDAVLVQDAAAPTPDASEAPDSSATPDASAPDASALDASVSDDASAMDAATDVRRVSAEAGCDVVPDRVITSTDAAFGLTLEIFTAMCDRAGGFVEIHPHCGGANTCKGFSYDEGVHVFTEHTCAGLNTCNGYSCVIP
jgi:hypothetical protein